MYSWSPREPLSHSSGQKDRFSFRVSVTHDPTTQFCMTNSVPGQSGKVKEQKEKKTVSVLTSLPSSALQSIGSSFPCSYCQKRPFFFLLKVVAAYMATAHFPIWGHSSGRVRRVKTRQIRKNVVQRVSPHFLARSGPLHHSLSKEGASPSELLIPAGLLSSTMEAFRGSNVRDRRGKKSTGNSLMRLPSSIFVFLSHSACYCLLFR